MKVIYTMEPFTADNWISNINVKKRVSKERIKSIIEESMIKDNLVDSYTLTNSEKFPFPWEKPNPLSFDDFFGENPDLNLVAREINELYERPERELSEHKAMVESELETATKLEIWEKFVKFHYASEYIEVKKSLGAPKKLEELWGPYEQISKELITIEFNYRRTQLIDQLKFLDDCHARGFFREKREMEDLLGAGKFDEAKQRVMRTYENWAENNLAKLYHQCFKEIGYAEGYWMARFVVPPEGPKVSRDLHDSINTSEKMLGFFKRPFQVVSL